MKIYIPIPIEQELPKEEGFYPCIFFCGTDQESMLSVNYSPEFSFHSESEDCTGITHWLGRIEMPTGGELVSWMLSNFITQLNDKQKKHLAKEFVQRSGLLPTDEEIEKFADEYSEHFLDDPHNISAYAFKDGANYILDKIK